MNTSTSEIPRTPVSFAYDPEYRSSFNCWPAQVRSGPATVIPSCSAGDVGPRGTAYFARMVSTYWSGVIEEPLLAEKHASQLRPCSPRVRHLKCYRFAGSTYIARTCR